jgi:hypothetical protein
MQAVQVAEVEVDDRREQHQPGGVDDRVDVAEGLLDLRERQISGLLVGNVDLNGQGLSALLDDLPDYLVGLAGVAGVDHGDAIAIGREARRGGAADPARSSGDQGNSGIGGA